MREQKRTFMENLVSMPDIPDSLLQYATPKQRRIFKECAKPENQPPCKENQVKLTNNSSQYPNTELSKEVIKSSEAVVVMIVW